MVKGKNPAYRECCLFMAAVLLVVFVGAPVFCLTSITSIAQLLVPASVASRLPGTIINSRFFEETRTRLLSPGCEGSLIGNCNNFSGTRYYWAITPQATELTVKSDFLGIEHTVYIPHEENNMDHEIGDRWESE